MGILYTRMKIFHYRDKIESLPEENKEILPPIQIRIKPTNVCTHNCWYCAYRAENLQLGKDMIKTDHIPKDKMLEIINDIDEMGVKSVTFSGGGDPFCYPYLLDTVKRLSDSKVKFASLTNGSKLEGEVAEIFAHNATWLRVSVDGWDDESYSEYRRVKDGEFSKVIRNMENFVKMNGKCVLGICLIVDKKNAPHVYELIRKFKDVGVNNVKVAPCIVSNDVNENNEYHMPIFDNVKEQVSKAIEDFSNDGFEIFDSYHTQLETFEKDYEWCPFLQIVPVIGADLNVYSCHDKAYNLDSGILGSIKEQGLKDFWFSDKKNFFGINPSKHCNHHCVVNTHNKYLIEYLGADKEHLEFV